MTLILILFILGQATLIILKLAGAGYADFSWLVTLSPILVMVSIEIMYFLGETLSWVIDKFFSLFSGRAKRNIDKLYEKMIENKYS